jgi:hypothetical protein
VDDEELRNELRAQAKFFSGLRSKYNHPFNPVSTGVPGRAEFNTAFDEFNRDRVKLWEAICTDEHWSGECSLLILFPVHLFSLRTTIYDRFR